VTSRGKEAGMTTTLAFDPGYGNIKLFGRKGGLVMPSCVSVGSNPSLRRMAGLRTAKPPLRIEVQAGLFHVGENAHDWGRPVENLDFERLTSSPEMLALFYGAITRYGVPTDPVDLIVGLPIASLMGEEASATQQGVRSAFGGTHRWRADGAEHTLTVTAVHVTSQPVGAMFDYLLDDQGALLSSRRAAFKGEMGILGIGLNTVDLLVVRDSSPVQRFTTGGKLGVRRLLELLHPEGTYSLGELDGRLREGSLEVAKALPVWQSEVLGFIERHWGSAFGRFDVVLVVSGGALFLRESLLRRFRERLFVPYDPILATARGLYKYLLMRTRRRQP